MNTTEYTIRNLCWQDEQLDDIKYTEEEIQNFLKSDYPVFARLISGSVKLWRKEQDHNE